MDESVQIVIAEGYAQHVKDASFALMVTQIELDWSRERLVFKGGTQRDRVAATKDPDTLADGIARLDAIRESYRRQLDRYTVTAREFVEVVSHLDEAPARIMLRHYAELATWRELCKEFGYSYSGLMKLRRRSLLGIYPHIPERYKDALPKAL